MASSRSYGLIAAALAITVFACATPQQRDLRRFELKEEGSIKKLLKKSESAALKKDLRGELAVYREMVEKFPENQLSAVAYYRLGKNHLNLRNYFSALIRFEKVTTLFPKSKYYQDSLLGVGICQVYLKKHTEAGETLQKALSIARSPEIRSSLLYHVGENFYMEDRYMEAVDWFVKCSEVPGDFRKQAQRRIKLIFHDFLSERRLLAIVDRYNDAFPADVALAELARIYSRNSDMLSLVKLMEIIDERFPGMALPSEATIPEISAITNVLTVGCILPLSGKNSVEGTQALQGIQLAFSINNELAQKMGIRLIIKDSASDTETARKAAEELERDISVIGVIGPLGSATARSILSVSDEYFLPFLTPTQSGAIDLLTFEEYPPVYRTGLSPQGQGRLIAELAVNKMGFSRMAVIYQDDEYGKPAMDSFVQTATFLGAEVVAVEKYAPSATDFGRQIKGVGGIDDSLLRALIYNVVLQEPKKSPDEINEILNTTYRDGLAVPYINKYKELPLTRDNFSLGLKVNYEAIFIPANHTNAALILPELSFYNISGVQVFGTDRYGSPKLVQIAGKYAEGVIFAGEFLPGSDREEVKIFVKQFEAAFGRQPDVNAARSYDTVSLFLSMIAGGVDSKTRFVEFLGKLPRFEGVSGIFGTADGELSIKTPYLMTIKESKIVDYEPPEPLE